jgi:CheY-like chemotaxis protein
MERGNIDALAASSDTDHSDCFSHGGNRMSHRMTAITFDLDAASLTSLREALPEWEIKVVNGATAASLFPDWNPGVADLLIVMAHEEVEETLGLCRFLVFCSGFSGDSRGEAAETAAKHRSWPNQTRRVDAPLLVLVPSGQEPLVRAALEAGADRCLVLPVHAREVTSMLARVRHRDRPGQHTLNLGQAQAEDRWQDDGGQG